jgi:hypothetical protein
MPLVKRSSRGRKVSIPTPTTFDLYYRCLIIHGPSYKVGLHSRHIRCKLQNRGFHRRRVPLMTEFIITLYQHDICAYIQYILTGVTAWCFWNLQNSSSGNLHCDGKRGGGKGGGGEIDCSLRATTQRWTGGGKRLRDLSLDLLPPPVPGDR